MNSAPSLPLISIITVNYNHSEVTCDMLQSLSQITYPNIEVIVIDNASPDDNPGIIKERFPWVTLILNAENLGFAGANNEGIQRSRGDYILLLNNDTVVTTGFLEPLIRKMQSDPLIGAISPKIKYFYEPDTLQFTGITPINPYTGRSQGIGFGKKDTGQFEIDTLSAFAHGAVMMISREAIRKIGLMSVAYFLYYEELDWGYRLRQAGYKIYYVHDSLVFHKESVSIGRLSPLKTYYLNRSRWLYIRRNVKGYKFLISILFQFFFSIPKNSFTYLLQGRKDLFLAYHSALWWHVKNLFKKDLFGNPCLNE